MTDSQERAAPSEVREARRLLWGTWPPRRVDSIPTLEPDEVVTAPDAPNALAPISLLPRARLAANAQTQTDSMPSGELLAVGQVVGGRYVIEQHVSSGGFGAVYRASDRDIRHHQVALKVLHHRSASEDERKVALRELKLLATVTHPSVVQFKEYGWHEGRLWFAMPWYRGRTLDRMLFDGDAVLPMDRADARLLFTRLAHGLAAMHAVGVHHHDIKPENIFVADIAGFSGGLPVLLDLGIATQRGEHPVGLTVEYASPETAAAMLGDATRTIGGAADVYSLSLVLRNALDPSLAQPARSSQLKHLLRARATQAPAFSQKRELQYLKPYFQRWLSQDPNQRPTAAELAVELAILTEPEERRQARVRFVQRVAPGALVFGALVAALSLQLNRKETALVVQRRALEEERREGEVLRKQAAAQLEQLDRSARTLGDERRLLKRTLTFARTLHERLSAVTSRLEELDKRHAELTKERDELLLLTERLNAERDTQVAAQAAWAEERQTLLEARAKLRAELDEMTEERTELARQRDELQAKLERGQAALTARDERLVALQARLTKLAEQPAPRPKVRAAKPVQAKKPQRRPVGVKVKRPRVRRGSP